MSPTAVLHAPQADEESCVVMVGNPIQVGYYDPFNVFPLLEKQLESKLPLLNLYWRHANNKPTKAILSLPVQFVPEIPKRTSINVYLHMALVQCSSIDTYRTQVRPLLKEWLRLVVSPDNVEWIIVLFVPKNTKDVHLSLMKLLIIDKLRVDFGNDGKELPEGFINRDGSRIVKIKEYYEEQGKRSEMLNEYITLIKKCLLSSFTTRYQVYSGLQSLEGRLSLAELFKDMRLYDESLNTYALLSNSFEDHSPVSIPKDLSAYRFRKLDRILTSSENQDGFLYRSRLFLEQTDLLVLLADLATDSGVATKYLASLYQKLLTFLQSIVSQAPGAKAAEWAYAVADNYLDIDFKVEIDKIPVVLGYQGELRLFQRSQLMKLGKLSYKYKIYGAAAITSEVDFDDINLNDGDDDTLSVTTKEPEQITYEPLIEILESETSFYDKFQEITEQAIRNFHASSRQNSIDVLSMDIALIKFYRKQYKEALDILSNSYAYFLQNGWNFMGGILLEAYLMCLEKVEEVPNYAMLLKMSLQLLGTLHTRKADIGINNYKLLKDTNKVQLLFEKVVNYSKNLDEVFQYDSTDVFDIEVVPIIEGDRHLKCDIYFIEIELGNKFPIDVHIESVTLYLKNGSHTITFEHGSCNIVKNSSKTTLKLTSSSFTRGYFSVQKISIFLHEKLELVENFACKNMSFDDENTIDGDDSVLCTRPTTLEFKPEVYFLNQKGKLRMQFQNPPVERLGHNEINLLISCGMCDITGLQVTIKSQSPGFICSHSDVVAVNELCVLNEDGLISTPNVKAAEELTLKIPYKSLNGEKLLQMNAVLSYDINGEKFHHEINDSIDISLSLSVSVLDIFKEGYIFSNFQVGPSNSRRPIRIISTNLTTQGDDYSIVKPVITPERIVAFTELPASFFYKIEPRKDYQIDPEDSFELEVKYQNVCNELTHKFEDYIYSQFENDSIDYYSYFIQDQIISKIEFDINCYSQKGSIKIINNRIMRIITPNVIDKHVLKQSHKTILLNVFMDLFEDDREWEPANLDLDSQLRTLIISVPIPVLKVLQIVEYSFEKQQQFTVGESVRIIIKVTTSRRWWSQKYENNAPKEHQDKDEFQLSIVPDENWLVSGFKRKIFEVPRTMKTEELSTFDFVFTPLSVGRILLPKVDVQFTSVDKDGTSMDIIYRNGLEPLLVVPEIESITFSF